MTESGPPKIILLSDALSRLKTALGAIDQVTEFRYDVEDNLSTVTDAQSNVTSNSYDALNRLIEIEDRRSFETSMDYNDADQIIEYTDTRTLVTEFEYNGFGEVVQETSPDRGIMSYVYDERGLVTSMTDGRSIVTTYSYDDGGRLTARNFPSSTAENQTFTYDSTAGGSEGEGKIATITDEFGSISRSYANGGYLSQDSRTIEGEQYDVTYQFDSYGRLDWVETPGALRIFYKYDTQDRVNRIRIQRRIIDPQTGQYPPVEDVVQPVLYAPFGPVTELGYGDGAMRNYVFDDSYRLTGDLDQKGTTTLREVVYAWTDRDNLSAITDPVAFGQPETFTYNAEELLRTATGSYDGITYSYGPNRDRTKYTVDDGTTATEDVYAYPATNNRLQSISLGARGTRSFTYDGSGYIVADTEGGVTKSYSYNAANRLSALDNDGVAGNEYEYGYNALGQQVVRHEVASGDTIHVVHDADGNRLAEYAYDPATQTSTLLREYIWLDGLPVGVVESGTLYYVRTDHIGRPIYATDNAGTKVWEVSYLPFGNVETSTGTPMELRFPGQWYQSESGLYQNWMRDYDPTTGRHIQADPLGLVDGPSVYGYALQNPGRYTDPTGEFIPLGAMAAGAALGAGLAFLDEYLSAGGRFECVNWFKVGIGAGIGVAGGAFVNGALKGLAFAHRGGRSASTKAFRNAYGIRGRGTEVHHGLVRANGFSGASLRHHFMNYRPMSQASHRRIHGKWGGRGRYPGPIGDLLGAPAWLQGGAGMIGIGAATEILDGECGCGN